jgi:16S rRNA C967 or C1407 C5-methylase (RsmB/RsmF family)/NOL1/NOP2/fmu family ribosome biogenesis protein
MSALLTTAYPSFEAALDTPPPVSIRLHPHKPRQEPYALPIKNGQEKAAWLMPVSSKAGEGVVPIPWHPQGFYLPERPLFTLDPALHAGGYYVQEASSMFLYEALRQSLDFSQPLKALDLCAAPGGKSTLLSDLLSPDSLLVANEVVRQRAGILRENLERWGRPNIGITHAEASDFTALTGFFDLVVCDAPCSGEGLFRKDPDAVREWSPQAVSHCAQRQKDILESAISALRPGGLLVYSTCTYNRSENEENVQWAQQQFELELISLDLPANWSITASDAGYRFFPHRTSGEGFFIALLKKKDGESPKPAVPSAFKQIKSLPKARTAEPQKWLNTQWAAKLYLSPSEEIIALPEALEADYLILDKHLKTKWFGLNIGEMKGSDFIPSHALALSLWASEQLPKTALPYTQALLYLKKESVQVPDDSPKGWTLATHNGLPLGWIKVLPNRVNNYLPMDRKIRMSI